MHVWCVSLNQSFIHSFIQRECLYSPQVIQIFDRLANLIFILRPSRHQTCHPCVRVLVPVQSVIGLLQAVQKIRSWFFTPDLAVTFTVMPWPSKSHQGHCSFLAWLPNPKYHANKIFIAMNRLPKTSNSINIYRRRRHKMC